MKLLDVLKMIDKDNVPFSKIVNEDIMPNSVFKVNICYMCEEETWIKTYASHPILVPLYDAIVTAFSPGDENTLDIWIHRDHWLSK